jgi:hypothetical protein
MNATSGPAPRERDGSRPMSRGLCGGWLSAQLHQRRQAGAQADVAARLAELRERDPDIVAPEAVIARLVRLAEACGALGTAPALKEARIALLEAHKLQAQLSARYDEEAFHREPDRELTLEEWLMIWGTDEDKRKLLAGEHFCQAMAARTTNPGDAFAVAS